MASLKTASKPKKANGAKKEPVKQGGKPAAFADYLLARAPAEDVAAYSAADLQRAADLARKAVARHRKGESVVAIDTESGVARDGRPVTVITVVNDNMPFLFDSLLG
jgi:glutamate dehydrogenase